MYSQELGNAICEALESGKSLRAAAAELGTTSQSVLRWTEANKAFAEQYAAARARSYAMLGDELMDDATAEHASMDVAAARLRFDARRWMLSKMLPKVYGDKVETTHTGTLTVESIKRLVVDPATKTMIEAKK